MEKMRTFWERMIHSLGIQGRNDNHLMLRKHGWSCAWTLKMQPSQRAGCCMEKKMEFFKRGWFTVLGIQGRNHNHLMFIKHGWSCAWTLTMQPSLWNFFFNFLMSLMLGFVEMPPCFDATFMLNVSRDIYIWLKRYNNHIWEELQQPLCRA